ncbi:MAG: DUF1080 domain-containing protein [Acidobacteriota bacterium]|nr:MAG: DUF1080 domain-containing protein [Acidobacteriota bacterium]
MTEEEKAAGWKLLFDGQSLAGWEDPASEDPPGDSWTVVDGCIRATNDPQIREDLPTLETFGDFELSWEWKISQGGNSGLKYRIQDRVYLAEGLTNPDAKRFEDTVDYELTNRGTKRTDITPGEKNEEYVVAFEYQLIDNDGHPDARASLDRSAGAMYAMAAPTEQVTRPVGEWNESRIVLRGMHVEHWLNGTKIVEADLDSEQVLAGVKKRWTTDSPVYQMLAEQPQRKTPIVLQNHNDEAWFRSIKIREF